jgi:hypothetical protein
MKQFLKNIVNDVDSFSTKLRTLPNMILKPYLKTFKDIFLTTKLSLFFTILIPMYITWIS